MNDHDRRQLERMRSQLEAYAAGRIDLSWLISSLEALQNALESVAEPWRDAFREQWGVLEVVYSVAVVREQQIESAENKALVEPALKRMRGMIDEVLAG